MRVGHFFFSPSFSPERIYGRTLKRSFLQLHIRSQKSLSLSNSKRKRERFIARLFEGRKAGCKQSLSLILKHGIAEREHQRRIQSIRVYATQQCVPVAKKPVFPISKHTFLTFFLFRSLSSLSRVYVSRRE